jgi:hypothetical protein
MLEGLLQQLKHEREMVWTEVGIRIDWSDEHGENADSPRSETLRKDLNGTGRINSQQSKHPAYIVSISPPIVKSPSFPKYRIRIVPLKFIRKAPETLKETFAASTVILSIPEPANAQPVTRRRRAGRQIDCRDGHPPNGGWQRLERWEPDSNVKFHRFPHPPKQWPGRVSTHERIQIGCSDEQDINAPEARSKNWQPGSNVKSARLSQPWKQ